MFKPTHFVLHHTGGHLGSARAISRQYKYHVLIDYDVLKESWHVIQSVPDNQQSVRGTGRFNSRAYCVCVCGNYENMPVSDDLLHTIVQVIAVKMISTINRCGYPDRIMPIVGHRHVGEMVYPRYGTLCPGKHLVQRLPEIRSRVLTYL